MTEVSDVVFFNVTKSAVAIYMCITSLTFPKSALLSYKQMYDNYICLPSTMLTQLMSRVGEHHGLCGVRAGRPLPDTDPGHAKCRHGHQGSRGTGCRALACGVPLAAVSVSPKPGQCQPQWRVDRLRSQRLPRG